MRYFRALAVFWALSVALIAQEVGLPPRPQISPAGYRLILEYEVGGGSVYYTRFLARPTWPGFESGVTVGVGYDCGYNTRPVILADWRACAENGRLAASAGIRGQAARPVAFSMRDVFIEWRLAEEVFQTTTLSRFWQLAARTFPGFEELRPDAQAAIVSLVFNRGSSLAGPRRGEMRAIRGLVPRRDYAGIARQIRAMKKIWRGTDIEEGMVRRREAEARLVEGAVGL